MECRNCKKAELQTSTEDYLYTHSGLPNVTLVGIEVRRCPECGEAHGVFPRLEALFRTIVFAVVHKQTRLSGVEVRFLRNYLDLPEPSWFAMHMGVDPGRVSSWENDTAPIGPVHDRLLRMMVVHEVPIEKYELVELTKIVEGPAQPLSIQLRPMAKGWELAATDSFGNRTNRAWFDPYELVAE